MGATSVHAKDGFSVGTFASAAAVSAPGRAEGERFVFLGEGKWRTLQVVQSSRVRSLKPFTIDFELGAELATVSHESSELYGAGRCLEDARRDFSAATLDLFEFLSSLRPEELGPLPQAQLQVLRAHLSFI